MASLESPISDGDTVASLREALRERDLVLDSSPVALAMVRDGTISWSNRRIEELFGYSRDEMRGQDTSLFHAWSESHDRLARAAQSVLAAGSTYATDERMRRKNGSTFWCRLRVRAAGKPGVTVWSFEDISEQKAVATALAASRARLERVIRGSLEGYFEINLTTGRVERSPRVSEMLGVGPDSIKPTVEGWMEWIHPDDALGFREALATLTDPTATLDLTCRVRTRDGEYRWMHSRAAQVQGTADQVIVSGMIGDVTDQRLAQERIAEALARNEQLVNELRASLEQVKTVSGLLPICMYCKKIRDDAGYWERLEEYFSNRTDALFSHSICPECVGTHFGDLGIK